jgi:hypothetical protein
VSGTGAVQATAAKSSKAKHPKISVSSFLFMAVPLFYLMKLTGFPGFAIFLLPSFFKRQCCFFMKYPAGFEIRSAGRFLITYGAIFHILSLFRERAFTMMVSSLTILSLPRFLRGKQHQRKDLFSIAAVIFYAA